MVIAFGGCAAALLLLDRAGGQAAPSLTRGRPTRCTGITSATLCIADVRWHLRTWPHAAFLLSRRPVHRTHGQVIGVRAEPDRAALQPLPPTGYQVVDRHLRRGGRTVSSRSSPPATPPGPSRSPLA